MKRKGFIAIELIITLMFIGLLASQLINIYIEVEKGKKRTETDQKIKVIESTWRTIFIKNSKYAQSNCVGWDDNNCQDLMLTPEINDDGTEISFYTQDEKDLGDIKKYCKLIENTGNKYTFQCKNGFGKVMVFNLTNGQTKGQDYILPYNNQYPMLDIDAGYKKVTININDLINYAVTKTLEKEVDISNALKKFARTLSLKEFANDCSDGGNPANPANGLGSWDDSMVPWLWRVVSIDSTQLCTGGTDPNSCGCDLFKNDSTFWETDSYFCIINSGDTWQRVLINLGLGNVYRTDGFGNKLTMSMLSDSNGNPKGCPPKAPQPGYYYAPTYPKVRIGVVDGCTKSANGNTFDGNCNWYSYVDVYTQ